MSRIECRRAVTIAAMKELLKKLHAGGTLSAEEAETAFAQIMEGAADAVHVSSLLTMLAVREPTVEELVGAARVMRRHVLHVAAPAGTIDTCGTGGVGSKLFNVSTTAALVAAGCGVKVAKHGNRAFTSASGSADVLKALGVNVETTPEQEAQCLREANICFAFAVRHHPAMKHVSEVRKTLGFGTIFNTLGPISNPAGVRRQLIGVKSPAFADKLLEVMIELGAERVMLVSGEDRTAGGTPLRICEVSISGPTYVATWDGKTKHALTFHPGDVGMKETPSAEISVGSVEESARMVTGVLNGEKGPARDIVLLNAAACLWVGDQEHDFAKAVAAAGACLEKGEAKGALSRLIAASHAA
jgi:anthranilate phosphoribosyltransferase